MNVIHDDELRRQAARLAWKAAQLELEAQREPGSIVLIAARPAMLAEIPRGAFSVGRPARQNGFAVTPTYAKALIVANVKCQGGAAVWATTEEGEQWICPACGVDGARTKSGAIRAHGARGADGRIRTQRVPLESLALRMYRHDDDRRAVAIWHNGRFNTAIVMRPLLGVMGCEQIAQWVCEK